MVAQDVAELMHGHDWQGQPIAGWHLTEKLDGCRARWTGAALVSRPGRPIAAPERITRALPALALDCEVYAGPAGRQLAAAAVQRGQWHPSVRLVTFDAPHAAGDLPQRLAAARAIGAPATVPEHGRVTTLAHLLAMLERVRAAGGEGLMAHRPGTAYVPGRSHALVKVKCLHTLREALQHAAQDVAELRLRHASESHREGGVDKAMRMRKPAPLRALHEPPSRTRS